MKRTILAVAAALAVGCSGADADPCGVVSRDDRLVFVCPGIMEEAECRPEAAGDNLLPDVFYADGFTCFGRLPRPVYQ